MKLYILCACVVISRYWQLPWSTACLLGATCPCRKQDKPSMTIWNGVEVISQLFADEVYRSEMPWTSILYLAPREYPSTWPHWSMHQLLTCAKAASGILLYGSRCSQHGECAMSWTSLGAWHDVRLYYFVLLVPSATLSAVTGIVWAHTCFDMWPVLDFQWLLTLYNLIVYLSHWVWDLCSLDTRASHVFFLSFFLLELYFLEGNPKRQILHCTAINPVKREEEWVS